MLKQRLFRLIIAAVLMLGAAGAGIVADALGMPVTPSTFACDAPDHSGGGC